MEAKVARQIAERNRTKNNTRQYHFVKAKVQDRAAIGMTYPLAKCNRETVAKLRAEGFTCRGLLIYLIGW